ncbi:hypothetical protein HK096_010411, partial [Nowakowskiella sp. JEL0078]
FLNSDQTPLWQRVIIMEIYRGLCCDFQLMRNLFVLFDAKGLQNGVFLEIISNVGKVVLLEKPHILSLSPSSLNLADVQQIGNSTHETNVAVSTNSMKVQCIDQLDKGEPPAIPETYLLYLAIHSITGFIESSVSNTLPILRKFEKINESDDTNVINQFRKMMENSWAGLLNSLAFLLISPLDEETFFSIINSYQYFTIILALLGLNSARNTFITSLCHMCVPVGSPLSFESNSSALNPQSLLSDRNIHCIRGLLNIAQSCTQILDEKAWYMILETLQIAEIYVTSGKTGRRDGHTISSPALLGVPDVHGSKSIKDKSSSFTNFVPPPSFQNSGSILSSPALLNATIDNSAINLVIVAKKLFESSKQMDDLSFSEFIRALAKLSRDSAIGGINLGNAWAAAGRDSKIADEKCVSLTRLHEVVLINVERLISSKSDVENEKIVIRHNFEIWDDVINCFLEISHAPQVSMSIRTQVLNTLSEVLTTGLQLSDLNEHAVDELSLEIKILEPLKRLLFVGDISVGTNYQNPGGDVDLGAAFAVMEKVTRGSWFSDIQKSGLETLLRMLQSSGQKLSDGWGFVMEVVRSVVISTMKQRRTIDFSVVEPMALVSNVGQSPIGGTGTGVSKASQIIRVAMKCVELVCTDFLSLLTPKILSQCVDTLSYFGSQIEDLNISLAAVGLLWTVSDFVLTKRSGLKDDQVKEIDVEQIPAIQEMDKLWMIILDSLSQLCSDLRPEVRNSANQTLFRTIGINGRLLTIEAWDECIWNVLFPLLERVKVSSDRTDGTSSKISVDPQTPSKRVSFTGSLPIHHSRNTASKQWDETKVLTLSGVAKCFIDFLPVLITLEGRFNRAWALFLEYVKEWCLNGSTEVSVAALKAMRVLVRFHVDASDSTGTTRISLPEKYNDQVIELWRIAWDVWEAIGYGIIASSDENCKTSGIGSGSMNSISEFSKGINSVGGETVMVDLIFPSQVLHGSFTQETFNSYIAVFPDIYDIIQSVFGPFELKRLLFVLTHLLTYHTNSTATGKTRLASDFIMSDVEVMSPFQQSVFDIVAGIARPDILKSDSVSNSQNRIPVMMLAVLAFFTNLAFIRTQYFGAQLSLFSNVPSKIPISTIPEKGFTYIALSKRSISILVTFFENYYDSKLVYSTRVFEACIEALGVPMRARYDCPSVSKSIGESVTLWKLSASACLKIVNKGIVSLEEFVKDLPEGIVIGILSRIIDVFDGFLLSTSQPPTTITQEEITADDEFDVSIISSIESDFIPLLGKSFVPDTLIVRFAEVIRRASRLYTSTPSDTITGTNSLNQIVIPLVKSPEMQINMNYPESVNKIRGTVEYSSAESLGPTDVVSRRGSIENQQRPNGEMNLRRDLLVSRSLEILFSMFSNEKTDLLAFRVRVAEIVAPFILEKTSQVIRLYAAERPLYGRLPMPRLRNDEILAIITIVGKMDIRSDILTKSLGNETNSIRSHIFAGQSAHIFYLYPVLCDCLSVVARHRSDEEKLVDAIRICLSRVGRELGVEN